jgi:hypothetical protein
MHSRAILTVLAGATTVVAQIIPGVDLSGISVVTEGSSGSLTTYLLECAATATGCPFDVGTATVVEGPSTVDLMYAASGISLSMGCTYTDSAVAVCSETEVVDQATTATTETVTLTGSYTAAYSTGAASSSAAASTGASATVNSATATASSTLATATSSGAAAATSSSSVSKSTNAAMAQVTGNALWVAGGAAMAMAMAIV